MSLDPLLERIKPVIYVPLELTKFQLIDVLYEKFDSYYILWFHWPFDGPISFDSKGIQHEDYEPVILVHNNHKLLKIGIRPHNRYESSLKWHDESGNPVVIFSTPWHGAIVDTNSAIHKTIKKAQKRIPDYTLKQGKPPDSWFFAADATMTVYDYADSL